jgi:signal transduction histidine kinase
MTPETRNLLLLVAAALLIGGCGAILLVRIGRWRRAREAREAFAQRLLESQEEERRRIAAELHDSLGQSLLIVKNRAELAARMPDLPPAAAELLRQISETTQEAIEEVRSIVQALRPTHLDRLGLSRALRGMLVQVAASGAFRLQWHVDAVDGAVPKEREIDLYRVVQEALTNVIKHSSAAVARVEVRREENAVAVEIEDDGRGFDSQTPVADHASQTLGLSGIQQRIRMLGGTLDLRSTPGKGTMLRASIPVVAVAK